MTDQQAVPMGSVPIAPVEAPQPATFVIRHGRRGRVVVHRADCGMLDTDYYESGVRESADSFGEAAARARQLTRPNGHEPHLCPWCRPAAQR